MKDTFAFVLGNGTSRLSLNFEKIQGRGTIYGCNRIYQDHPVDVLVSVDVKIAKEIQESGYSKNHTHYTRKSNIIYNSGALPIEKNPGHSSGPVAAKLAAVSVDPYYTHIFLIGMDLRGTENKKINNIYAGTEFYKDPAAAETYYGNWVNQIQGVIQEHRTQQFFHVNPYLNFTPEQWKHKNFSTIGLDEFYSMINT